MKGVKNTGFEAGSPGRGADLEGSKQVFNRAWFSLYLSLYLSLSSKLAPSTRRGVAQRQCKRQRLREALGAQLAGQVGLLARRIVSALAPLEKGHDDEARESAGAAEKPVAQPRAGIRRAA